MRIAIVGPTFPYKGGGAHHTTELAHRLAAAGHDVTLESWRTQYPSFAYPGRLKISEPEGEPFPATQWALSWHSPAGWVRAGRRLRSADLVVFTVLTPLQVPAYHGIIVGLGRHRPRTAALCHNVLPHERKAYDPMLMRTLLRRVDHVLVHSAEQAALARALAPTPVRLAGLPPHLPARRAGGERPARRYDRLLFFGIVRPYKGLDILLRAMAAGPPEVSLTVAGEFWGGLDETRRLVRALGLTDRVELQPGYVPATAIPELFDGVDALVLPYRSATASQNVALAFEQGVPVIATTAGALAEHVRDGVDGVLCEPGDVGSLTDALKRFYAEGEPDRLRRGVRAVDPAPYWDRYLEELLKP
ncbi:MAG TPA: glycosyltransferase family 4 protein [Streptosporangiaceae bacterium]|nr:glycosyltransferase family 4 protein [Streptosporangiaceae bacterium]